MKNKATSSFAGNCKSSPELCKKCFGFWSLCLHNVLVSCKKRSKDHRKSWGGLNLFAVLCPVVALSLIGSGPGLSLDTSDGMTNVIITVKRKCSCGISRVIWTGRKVDVLPLYDGQLKRILAFLPFLPTLKDLKHSPFTFIIFIAYVLAQDSVSVPGSSEGWLLSKGRQSRSHGWLWHRLCVHWWGAVLLGGVWTRWAEPGAGNEWGDEPGPGSGWGQQMMQPERRLQQRSQVYLGDRAGDELESPHKVSIQEMSYLECRAEAKANCLIYGLSEMCT